MDKKFVYIDKILDIIQSQFLAVMASDPEYYGQYKIILSNEQQYVKIKDRNTKAIYIVVKFVPGSLNFGQNVIPVNFNALGEGNKVEVCQRLLLEYAQQFNLGDAITIPATESEDGNRYIIKQVYTQPQIMSNFNETWNEFRSLFFMSGSILLGKNSLPITKIIYYDTESDEKGTDIDFITSSWDFAIQLDSQAFYGTNSRTTSKAKIGTLTVGIISYLSSNPLCEKVRGIAWDLADDAPNGVKEEFFLSVEFADGKKKEKMKFKLANVSCPQNIGEFPIISMTLTN